MNTNMFLYYSSPFLKSKLPSERFPSSFPSSYEIPVSNNNGQWKVIIMKDYENGFNYDKQMEIITIRCSSQLTSNQQNKLFKFHNHKVSQQLNEHDVYLPSKVKETSFNIPFQQEQDMKERKKFIKAKVLHVCICQKAACDCE